MLKKNKRFWAGLLSLALILTQFSATAAALEDDESITVGMSNAVDSGQIQEDEIVDNPDITVGESDEKDSLVKTITSWKFVDEENLSEGVLALPGVSLENQADFDTVVSMLPTKINAVIEGEEDSSTLSIPGWACPEFVLDEKLNYPVSGEFTFTAKLPDGYACEPLPTVKVLLGGGSLYANEYGGLTITGDAVTQETDGQIKLTENNGNYTIKGTWSGTLSDLAWDKQKAVITVPTGVTANVILNVVEIKVSDVWSCAFAVETGGTANITLSNTNTLTSGGNRAGLEVPENANVTISGSGKLNANGGNTSAGIGGRSQSAVGTIEISGGMVTATSSQGAGIGSGYDSDGGTIKISGGMVTATSSSGAGIGGGYGSSGGSGGSIEISGGMVTATSSLGAGIGGGYSMSGKGGSGDKIVISGGMVTATSSLGAGIGGGSGRYGGDGGEITINGNAVVFAKSENAAHIGGGPGGELGTQNKTEGVVFEGDTGTVHGSPELPCDVKIPGSSTLTVPSGSTLTVPDGITLDNQGKIDNQGTITNNGTINGNGTIANSGTINDHSNGISVNTTGTPANKPSEVEITFSDSKNKNNPITQAAYGDTIQIIAKAQQRAVNTQSRVAARNKVDFYIGSVASGNHLGTADISSDSSTATATLDITITSDKGFNIGSNTITADFGGSSALNLLDSVGTATLTVRPQTQSALKLHGLANTYTYGDTAFKLSTSGGSGTGAVSYTSSNSAVASVTGDTVTIIKPGTFTITATKASDGNYNSTNVTSRTVTVREATPNLTLTATGETFSQPVILTATVSKVGIGTTPTGTVTFREGSEILEADLRLDGAGKATYTVNRPTVGNHTYTVEYSGQSGYYNRSSATCTVTVDSADQTGFMIESPGAKTYGDGRFTLTTSGGQSTGSVSFSVPDGNGILTVSGNGEVDIIGVGSVKITATKAGDSDYNQATATLDITVAPRNISNVMVTVKGNHVYTGNQIQPDFEVTDGTIAITKDDYTHQYDTNVDAGTDAGGIILTGQRNYTGTKTVKFDIEPRPLNDAIITLESGPFVYTGKAIEPTVTSVEVNGIPVPSESFEVGYADNIKAGTATVTVTAKADSNFSGTASTTFIIENVKNNSSGSTIVSGGGGSSRDSDTSSDKETTKSQTIPEPKRNYKAKGDKINQTISRTDLRKLANSGKSLTLISEKTGMTFSPAALKAILAGVPTSATNINFNATPADLGKFPEAAKLIGSHPVYNFAISYKSNNKTVPVKVNLPAGSVSIGVNYTPASSEITGNLFMVYVDDKGAVTWLNKSSYANGKVSAAVPHFSVYGVAYKSPETVFTDIGNHNAKKDIEWAVARELFPDTEKALFSPDSPMTKGMLVTALGKLSNVEPKNYQSRSFTDVTADASYAPYVEWAVQKSIIKTTSEKLFSPDEPITRENLAVIMANYAKQTGYSLSTPVTAVTFTDNDKISAWAKKEVTMMQRAGIMKGKDGSRFEPQSNSTRSEVSAILRRFVESII